MGRLWIAVPLLLASCTLEPLDLSGRDCPCQTPFVCDTASFTCQLPVRDDAAQQDGGVDASRDTVTTEDVPSDVVSPIDAPADGGSDVVDASADPPNDARPDSAGDVATDTVVSTAACTSWLSTAFECADFETGRLTPAWLAIETVSLSMTVAEDTTAVHIADSESYLQHDRAADWTDDSLYVRTSIYIPGTTPSLSVPIIILRGGGEFINFGLIDDRANVWASASGFTDRQTTTVARDRWLCLQLEVGMGTGRIRASLDGTLVGFTRSATTLSNLDRVVVGLIDAIPGTPQIYVDNVAYGAEELPCSPP